MAGAATFGGFATTVMAAGTEITVSPGLSVEELQDLLDSYSIIRFSPGNYTFSGHVPGDALLKITKPVRLVALDPGNRPVLNIANTAFPGYADIGNGGTEQTRTLTVAIPEGAASRSVGFEDLVLYLNREISINGSDDCDVLNCRIQNTNGGHTLWFGADGVPGSHRTIAGNVNVIGCELIGGSATTNLTFHQAVWTPDGTSWTYVTGNVVVSDNVIHNEGHSAIFTGTYEDVGWCTANFLITRNDLSGAFVIQNEQVGGHVVISHNRMTCNSYWAGWAAFGYITRGDDIVNGVIHFTKNRIEMAVKGVGGFSCAICFGAIGDVSNGVISNNQIRGLCDAGVVLGGENFNGEGAPSIATNCTVMGNSLEQLKLTWGPAYIIDVGCRNNIIRGHGENAWIFEPDNFVTGVTPMRGAPKRIGKLDRSPWSNRRQQ